MSSVSGRNVLPPLSPISPPEKGTKSRRSLTFLCLAFLLFLFPSSRLCAQQRQLSGTIVRQGHTSFEFALSSTDRSFLFVTTVQPDPMTNRFVLPNLPSGRYNLSVKTDQSLRYNTFVDLSVGNFEIPSSISLPFGDINGDFAIDFGDLSSLLQVYNAIQGDGLYEQNPAADLNRDGGIDFGDMSLMLQSYNFIGVGYVAKLGAMNTASGIKLSWTASAEATSFDVYRFKPGIDTVYNKIGNGVSGTTYTDNSAGRGGLYYVTVNGEPLRSNIASILRVATSLATLDTAQPAWAEDIIPTDSPASVGAGPSSATSIDVTTGIEESRPGADLSAYNATGQPAVFSRLYRSAQAERGYGSPGLPQGWTHNYDLTFTPSTASAWSPLLLTYPNGSKETINTDSLSGSLPTTFTPPAGTPYTVSGVPGATGHYTSLSLTLRDGSQMTFEERPSNSNIYRPTRMRADTATDNVLILNYDSNGRLTSLNSAVSPATTGTLLMSLSYSESNVSGVNWLTTVTDNVGTRTVTYTYTLFPASGVRQKSLLSTSQINSAAHLWEYNYTRIDNPNVAGPWLLLTQTGLPDPTTPGGIIRFSNVPVFDPGNGQITQFVDANGNTRNYLIGGNSTTVESRRSDGTLDLTYTQNADASGADTGMQDANGFVETTEYGDTANPKLPTKTTNRNGQVDAVVYDVYGNLLEATTPFKAGLLKTINTYTAPSPIFPLGALETTKSGRLDGTEAYRTSTIYSYYAGGENVGGLLQPRARLKSVQYPTPGDLTGARQTITYVYTTLGNLKSVTTPNAIGTTSTTTYTYGTPEKLGQPVSVSDPLSRVSAFTYDGRGNLKSVTNPAGNLTEYLYNDADQVTRVTMPGRQSSSGAVVRDYTVTTYLYVGGPVSQVDLYDGSNNTVFRSVNRQAGKEDEFKTAAGDTLQTPHQYDALYRVKQLQDGNLNPTGFTYDNKGNLKTQGYPKRSGGTFDQHSFGYDADDNLISHVTGRNATIGFPRATTQDSRLLGIQYNGALPDTTYEYDLYGRLSSENNGTATLAYAYDDLDNVTQMTTQYVGLSQSFVQAYVYNPDGSLKNQTLSGFAGTPSSFTYGYTYDAAGQLKNVSTPWSDQLTANYYQNGRLSIVTAPRNAANSLTTQYLYDPNGALTQLTNTTSGNLFDTYGTATYSSSVLLSEFRNLTYDPAGNRTLTNWNVPLLRAANGVPFNPDPMQPSGGATYSPGISGSLFYSYDNLDRLTQENDARSLPGAGGNAYYYMGTVLNPNTGRFSNYGADAADNLTTFRSGTLGYNEDNQLSSATYDGDGNPTVYGTANPTFDVENRLTGNAYFTARYRDDGLRAWKQTAGGKFYYLYNGTAVIAEIDSTGKVSNLFAYGASGLQQRRAVQSGITFGYTFDPSGNLVQRHTASNSSTVAVADFTTAYDGFGQQLGCVSVNLGGQFSNQDMVGFGGQLGGWTDNETDPTTNVSPNQRVPKRRFALVRMGFRDYDPAKGRFLERDPIDYAGGINLYAYAGNNPITHADPSGLQTPGVVLLQQEAAKEAGYKAGQYVTEKAAQQAAAKGVATVATRTVGTRILAATGVGLGIGARALPVVRTVMGLHTFYNWANGLGQEYLANISVSSEDIEADQPAFSRIPDSYLSSKFSVDMRPGPMSRTNAAGFPRSSSWFWRQMLSKYPRLFSVSNRAAILKDRAPIVDAQWIRDNPTHAGYKGNKLIHHHLNQGHRAAGLPERIHRRYHGTLHPD